MNPQVDHYLTEGCGRCSLGGTPQCKVHRWPRELETLRNLVLASGLTEEVKWGVPCYTSEGKNIVNVAAFKEYCALSFFKGSLMKDPEGILVKPGENSQEGRQIRFIDVSKIVELEATLKSYIQEAIAVEKAGLKIKKKPVSDYDMPEELLRKFEELPALQSAFGALTPGRKKGYLLHFTAAKQSKTRESRIEKCMPKIFEGKGLNDR